MFSRLPRDEALEKEDSIDEMKNIKSSPPIQHLLQAQQAVCFAFDIVGKWRPMIKKKKKKQQKNGYNNFNDAQKCYGQAYFCLKKLFYVPIAAYIRCVSHYCESFIYEIFYDCQRVLSKISELCIACGRWKARRTIV